MKTKNFTINTLWVLLLSLATSCNMLPDERLFDEPTDTPTETLPAIPDTLSVTGEIDGHDYVDLGLPSGTLWASCNVGALYPEEYGGYYAWGEIEEKEDYCWETYEWCNGSSSTMTKYCTDSRYSTVDNKTVLDPEDDVAHVKWGGSWRMPTTAEQDELRNNCTRTWTTLNGVNGQKFTSKTNGNSIFMPAAGFRRGSNVEYSSTHGYCWSSSLDGESNNCAYILHFFNGVIQCDCDRYFGYSVRPVYGEGIAPVTKYTVTVGSDGNGSVAIKDKDGISAEIEADSTVTVVATPDEGYAFDGWYVDGNETPVSADVEYTFTVSEDVALTARFEKAEINGHEYVDLGLPSGLKWATYNVGATKPEEYGGYYAWGEIERKNDFTWSTYKWCEGDEYSMTKYCIDGSYGIFDGKTVLDLEDDVAHVKWGGSWRMPTAEELLELIDNCAWMWTTLNGVNGCRLTSKINGNTIFFPAAGDFYLGTEIYNVGLHGGYWTSTIRDDLNSSAYGLIFANTAFIKRDYSRFDGHCVRAVSSEGIAPVVKYKVSVDSDGNGSVAIKDVDGTSATIEVGSTVTVVATPDEGYMFSGWFVAGNGTRVSTAAEYTFTVSEDVALTARFVQIVCEAVDLGLPSGLKWATCNVGATKPEEYGGYYAWGETEEKENYEWSTYKWCKGSKYTLTKYCISNSYGTVDNKTVLDLEDDVAHVKWGGSWRMPTDAEYEELSDNCRKYNTTQNGVKGCQFIGPNGNSIFLPVAGYRGGTDLNNSGSYGYYRLSSLAEGEYDSSPYYFSISISGYGLAPNDNRCRGLSVRPVSK